jgi:hypothetical protein
MERIAVIARLQPGAEGRAQALLEGGPPFDPETSGLVEHSVYIGNGLAVFVFEGDQVIRRLSDLVNDPVLSASFGAWAPVLADAPQLAHEAYHWRSDEDEST